MIEKSNAHLELNDEEKLIETNSSYYIEKFNKMRDKIPNSVGIGLVSYLMIYGSFTERCTLSVQS